MPSDAQPSSDVALRFRTLIEQLPAIIYTAALDEHSSTLYVSPQIEAILGFTPEEWMADPELWFKQIHEEDRQNVLAAVAQAQACDIPVSNEYRALTCDGRVVWLHDIASLVRDDAGCALFLQGVAVDITARRQAEAAQRAIEERYRSLIEATPSAIVVADMDTRISMVTPQAVRLFGCTTVEELLGRSIFELIAPEDHEKARHKIALALERGSGAAEYTLLRYDGSRFLAQLHAAIIFDEAGRPEAITGVLRDITEERRAEVALREREAHYRSLIEVSPDAIVQVDLRGTIVAANQQTAALLGYASASQLAGRSAFDFMAPEDRERAADGMQETLTLGEVRDLQYTLVRRDGSMRAVEFNARVVHDDTGMPQTVIAVVRDITDRKRAEVALRETLAHYRSLVEVSPDAIVQANLSATFVTANQQWAALLGYASADEVVGLSAFDVIVPEDQSLAHEGLSQILTQGSVRDLQYTLVRCDGTRMFAELNAQLVYNDTGTPQTIIAVVRDITDRKQAEQALRDSEERFRLLVDGVKDYAIYMLDPDGRVISWNAGAERIKGYRAEEIVGRHFSRFYPHEDIACAKPQQELMAAAAEGRFENEGWRIRKDGSRFWANTVISALYDEAGSLRGFAKVTRDDTDRKRAEQEREQLFAQVEAERERAEARIAELDAAFSAMTNGIVLYAPDGTIVRINEAAERMLGFTALSKHMPLVQRQALLRFTWANGQPVTNFDDVPVQRALRGETVQDVVLGIDSEQNGQFVWLSINAAPIWDADGRLLGAVLAFIDITARKQAETERARLFDQLQHLSRQLVLAQETERRNIARELHDESGQALTALKIRLEMLRADLPGEDAALRRELATAVAMVDTTMERMRSLALALRPPALDAVGLNAALEEYCQSFAEHIHLVVDYDAVEMPILPDPIGICLYRFLQEALTNIAKHARARRAWVVLQRDTEEISLSVEDDGQGFDPSILRSSANGLTHMGLLGMRERLQMLGGRLDVDLQPSRGVHLIAHIPWKEGQ